MKHEEETHNFLGDPANEPENVVRISDDPMDPDYAPFDDESGPECCSFCGKPFEEFSDLGCGHCDRRSPEWGIV